MTDMSFMRSKTARLEELLCNNRYGRRNCGQAVVDVWVVGVFFMWPTMDFTKRGLILFCLLAATGWLAWCGSRYNDANYTLFPAVMCAAECVVLILIARVIAKRDLEGEVDEGSN